MITLKALLKIGWNQTVMLHTVCKEGLYLWLSWTCFETISEEGTIPQVCIVTWNVSGLQAFLTHVIEMINKTVTDKYVHKGKQAKFLKFYNLWEKYLREYVPSPI